jgi:hypothetical protein
MFQPARRDEREQHSEPIEIYTWLRRNIGPVGVVLILGAIVLIALVIQESTRRELNKKPTIDPEVAKKQMEEAFADYYNHPVNRMLKRIREEGGASREAIRENILAADKTVTIEELKKNAEAHAGTPWAFNGKVAKIYESRDGFGLDKTTAKILIEGDPGKPIWVIGNFTTYFSEDSYVYAVGYIAGITYRERDRDFLTPDEIIPVLSARALVKPSEARVFLDGPETN